MPIEPIEPRFYQPITPLSPTVPEPQQFADEQEQESKPGWDWVGSPSRPEAKKHDDGISDLFEVGNEGDTSDLVSVDIDRDIVDANAEGNLDDLTAVSEEDILGDEDTGQVPLEYSPDDDEKLDAFNGQRQQTGYRRVRRIIRPRYTPPTSLGGMR